MSARYAIQTDNLLKIYKQGKSDPVHAVRELNLTVRPGEVFGLLGPNGAGKTTLVRILSTLLRASDGHAWVGGYDVQREEQQVRRIIGYAGQDSERSAHFRLTVRENLVYFSHGLRGLPLRTARERIDEIAGAVGFTDELDKQFITLSGGQKQLVIVIRALVHRPQIVFLDEPSKSLDPVTADRVRSFLVGYAQQHDMTVLLTTHNMGEAEAVCDRLAFLHKGRLQFVGTPREFRRSVTVNEIVEVSVSEGDGVYARLEDLPGVEQAIRNNGSVRLYCRDGFAVVKQVVNVLDGEDAKVSVSMVEPTLEDAFAVHVKEAERG